MKVYSDIVYDDLNNKLDIYTPDKENFSTIIFIHGGGFVEGDKAQDNIKEIGYSFVKSGYAFVSINYRLYPVAKYPDYLVDASNAITYIKNHIKEYGGNGKIIVSGQSAGAYTALMLALSNKYGDYSDICGFIIDSAQTTTHFRVLEKEYGLDSYLERIDDKAPIYYVNKDTKFSKMLLIAYQDDIVKRRAQNELFYQTIKHYNSNASIELKILKGGHCHGSCVKDDDNEYEYYKESIKWIRDNNVV